MSESFEQVEQTATLGDASATDAHAQEETQQTQSGAVSFWDRVAQDPDYAREQIRKRDATVSSLSNRMKELEPVEQVVKLAGGADQLFQLAQLGSRYQQIERVPGLNELIQQALATGRVESVAPTRNAQEEDDQWIDPDVKKVRDALTGEIASLKQQLAEMSRTAMSADVRSQEQRLRENVEKVLEDFGDFAEARDEAAQVMRETVQRALRLAENGDQTQAQLIRQLSDGRGIDILRSVSNEVYRKHFGPRAGAKSNIQNQSAQGSTARPATDERNVNPSRPGLSQLPPLPKGRIGDDFVARVFDEAARRRGVDPRLL